jgi:hypothetical protein
VGAAYSDHWLGNIRAKLAKPAAAGAYLTPAGYVGKAVHKAAEDFGVYSDDTVYSGAVVSYNADAHKWKAQYDQGAEQTTEEFTLQQMTAYHRGTMHDEDGGDEVHRDMLRHTCGPLPAVHVHGTCKEKWAHRRRSPVGMHARAPTAA